MPHGELGARALCLLSGSLESQLAVRVLQAQGLRVTALALRCALFDPIWPQRAAARLGVDLLTADFTLPMLRVLDGWRPRDRQAAPPCVACRTAMVAEAGRVLVEEGFDFLATGEVLDPEAPAGDAPSLERIARESGYEGYLVRPLSAQRLPPTEAEERGEVDRDRLWGLEGRAWREGEDWVARYELAAPPPPEALCALREARVAARVADSHAHGGLHGARELRLLRTGRHFRLGRSAKLVVGRNEAESFELEGMAELYDLLIQVEDRRGPTGLLPFTATAEEIRLAAAICARYAEQEGSPRASVRVRAPGRMERMEVAPMDPELAARYEI